MNFFCPITPDECFDQSNPVNNFSSEAPDEEVFIGRYYAPDVPNIGDVWYSTGCVGMCRSTISQEDADFCAQRQATQCVSEEDPEVVEDPDDPDGPPIIRPRTTYTNDEQECSFTCPDGSIFTQSIPAGLISAFSQAAADAAAQSLCQNEVIQNRICLGSLIPSGACLNEAYSGSVEVSGLNAPYVITLVSGSLPSGVVLSQDSNTAFITGTPASAGSFTFTLKAQDSEGNFATKSFTLSIVEITQDSLPDADFGQPYSQTLTVTGTTTGTITWSIASGSLPTGLTLNAATGEISGTPTQEGDFTFTVAMTDET